MEHIPPQQTLSFKLTSGGEYEFEFPSSTCYGVVVSGGIAMSAIHKASAEFVKRDQRTASHTNMVNMSLQFHRPVLPAPQRSVIELRVSNVNRLTTVLHVQLAQKKTCIVGYVMLSDLSTAGYVWQAPTPKLLPPPIPASIQSLESDCDPDWVGYWSPLELCGNCQVQSYFRVHIPRQDESRHKIDAWMTPGWRDGDQPNSVVWTNELVHFVMDNGIPPLYADLMHEDKTRRIYNQFVAAGLAQRKARAEGRSDRIRGEGLNEEDFVPYTLATLAVSTEIKKLLPPDGSKWLFMRSQTKGIQNDRMDYDVTLLDEGGDVVAVSHQIAHLVPLSSKHAKL